MTGRSVLSGKRVLEPGERFEEILFGLIMVLTFTCSLSVAEADRAEVRGMIVGALGCNLAWGIIDGAFYLIGVIAERGRNAHLLRQVQRASDPATGRALVAGSLSAHRLGGPRAGGARARAGVARRPAGARPEGEARPHGLAGSVRSLPAGVPRDLPVVLPFFFLGEVHAAVRLSNGVAIALIFWASWKLARHSGLRPFRTGAAMVGIGAALVEIVIALGG